MTFHKIVSIEELPFGLRGRTAEGHLYFSDLTRGGDYETAFALAAQSLEDQARAACRHLQSRSPTNHSTHILAELEHACASLPLLAAPLAA
ncbi:MAG: hypothetical protein K1Y36_30075 [Blastocatellia bacterium]|nr:hypothetical protein [Blastocatellia bacterium]